MYFSLVLGVLSASASANPLAWNRPGPRWHDGGKQAIYFLQVDPRGSSVVAIELGPNGELTDSTSVTSTGGYGLQSLNATSGTTTLADPLQGQQAVSVGGDYLFTINSGSDTAVMFKIDATNPLQLDMVGKPVTTLGQFPDSIAYSAKYQKACVLNGGTVNGVACYDVSPATGLVPDGVGLREYGFAATTPPVLGGPKGSGSDIQFTPDSSKLVSTFKGTSEPAGLGWISVFSVDEQGNVAAKATQNQVSPLAGPFGFALDGSNFEHLFISDVAFGGAVVSLDYETDVVSLVSVVNNTAFAASCWGVYSPVTDLFYNVNAADTTFGEINPQSGALEGIISYSTALGGAFDTVVAGPTAYFLTAVNEIGVIDLASGELLQTHTYGEASDRPYWTGMAMYPASPILYGAL